jgi:hypothetical protein
MASATSITKDVTADLTAALKELKAGDEDDLGELASRLDAVAEKADSAAGRLHKANEALEGSEQGQQDQEEQPEEGDEEQQQ